MLFPIFLLFNVLNLITFNPLSLSLSRTYKNVTLQERYPNICEKLFRNESHVCQSKQQQKNSKHNLSPILPISEDQAHDLGGRGEGESEDLYLGEEQENALINDPEVCT